MPTTEIAPGWQISQFGDSMVLEATPEAKLEAEAEYRLKNKRWDETEQQILNEVFGPHAAAMAAERGIPPQAFAGAAIPGRTSQDIHAAPGSYILRRNPVTGAMDTVFHAEEKKRDTTFKVPLAMDMLGKVNESVPMTEAEIRDAAANQRLPKSALDSETVKYLLSKPQAPISAVLPQRQSSGFIGTPGGANLFQDRASGYGFIGTPGQKNWFMEGFNATSGGKKLDASTAKQFLDQAGGNKAEARRLAKAAGYDL